MVTNVAMSSSSPEDIDCVVAVKFFGPQLSFCRYPGRSDSEWINLRIETLVSSPPGSCFPRKTTCFKLSDLEATLLDHGISVGSCTRSLDQYVRNPINMFKRLRLKNSQAVKDQTGASGFVPHE
ncbi:unnamed protein product [Microthlaspi erraticum]|uniref:Uncharacterized protein n=1 Tax=Microthlaspi erraticum TaxID=1685480 RepID=A0A6D2KUJ3_9BRAS|nr:unnamed protein product [Microthlaspi erraticum]